jgi:hypothetical protein
MEEEEKNRKEKGWDMGINMFFFWMAVLCLKKKKESEIKHMIYFKLLLFL